MATTHPFDARADALFAQLRKDGLWKELQTLDSPMDAEVTMIRNGRAERVLCFCSNNYLGLANHPEVIQAGHKALHDYGAGTASVRFICGTFTPHHVLEESIAKYMGTQASYTFVSAWTAAEALFPTLAEPGDWLISDELNHACIIDSIRLATTIKKGVNKAVYRNNVLEGEKSLRVALEQAREGMRQANTPNAQIFVVTDGVFSMEGSIADLPKMRALCDEYNAMLVVDDSHGHGVMGQTGRGTHEHWGMVDDLGTPALRAGEIETSRRGLRAAVTPETIDRIADSSTNPEPIGFVGRDPYPESTYGPVADLVMHRRNLPHIELASATYFVSWKCQEGMWLSADERRMVLDSLVHFDGDRARVYAACVMSNHVHWLVRPNDGESLSELCSSVKRFSARAVNQSRGVDGRLWDPESFDHVVRDAGYFTEFLRYIVRNPVEAKQATRASSYPATFVHIEAVGQAVEGGLSPRSESGGTRNNPGRVDIFTGTLGKALGGGAGGFIAGSQRVIDLIVQRARPTLFSNALPVTVAASANAAINIIMREPERVQRLRDNVQYARKRFKDAGFDVLPSPTAICPIIVHDTAKAIAMSKRLLDMGVFVIGFGYPVVPEGHARLRCQISAAHTTQHIDTLVDALKKL